MEDKVINYYEILQILEEADNRLSMGDLLMVQVMLLGLIAKVDTQIRSDRNRRISDD